MEAMSDVLETARAFNEEWGILGTQSGGWQLRLESGGGALITYLMNPCSANLGEEGKPYQVNFRGISNFETLIEALRHVHADELIAHYRGFTVTVAYEKPNEQAPEGDICYIATVRNQAIALLISRSKATTYKYAECGFDSPEQAIESAKLFIDGLIAEAKQFIEVLTKELSALGDRH